MTSKDNGQEYFAELLPEMTSKNNMGVYDKWASTYDQDLDKRQYKGPAIGAKELAKLLGAKKDARILDCGCGTGLLGAELTKLGYTNFDGIDPNTAMLEKAKERGVYKKVVNEFVTDKMYDIANDTYDACIFVTSFGEGMADCSCLKEIMRITKRGGYVIILSSQKYGFCGLYEEKWFPQFKALEDKGHWKILKKELIPDIFVDSPTNFTSFQIL